MYNPWGKVAGSFAGETPTFAAKAARVTHQMLEDANANTIMATGLTTAGLGAGIGAINGAVSYDGTFLGGAVNGAMLGGLGGAGIKGFASVYSSGVARTPGVKDFRWKTFNEGVGWSK